MSTTATFSFSNLASLEKTLNSHARTAAQSDISDDSRTVAYRDMVRAASQLRQACVGSAVMARSNAKGRNAILRAEAAARAA